MTDGDRQIVVRARAGRVRIFGVTLTQSAGALPGAALEAAYYDAWKDALRQRINGWIRANGTSDAVADFDRLLADLSGSARRLPLLRQW